VSANNVAHMNLGFAVLKRLAFRFVLLKRAYTEREFAQFVKQPEFPSATIEETIGLDIWLEKK